MSIAPNRLLTIISALILPSFIGFSAVVPPPPPQGAPPGPGFPIDSGVMVLLIISIIFGLYKVYKFNQIKKASN